MSYGLRKSAVSNFSITYVYEQVFLFMKNNKTKTRSQLTDI